MRLLKILLAAGFISTAFFVSAEVDNLPTQTLFLNVHVWDGTSDGITKKINVLVENNLIKKVRADKSDAHKEAVIIDGAGKVLMPGLIESHAHLGVPLKLSKLMNDVDFMYWGAVSGTITTDYLMRGYTTVRDAGGPAIGLHHAVEDGKLIGPRIYASGVILSQTSGHGDHRAYNVPHPNLSGNKPIQFQSPTGIEILCDGVPEVLRCTREALRMGSVHVKLMVGGGVSSSVDPLYTIQYLPEEIEAAVRAATDYGTYVLAHAYTDETIIRSMDSGVRVIEHGTLMTEKGMKAIMEKDAWLNPYFSMLAIPFEDIAAYVGPENVSKARTLLKGAENQIRIIKESGYDKIGFGSDVKGEIEKHRYSNKEFLIRAKYWPTVEVLKQATYNNGRLLKETGKRNPYPEGDIGVIEEGAYADMILVDGNPLENIELLVDTLNTLKVIMKDGKIYKNTLTTPTSIK